MPTEVTTTTPFIRWKDKGGNFYEYEISPDDRVWFARCLWREGAPMDKVGWTLLQRFAMVQKKYSSLTTFLRAYCQPVNPLWLPGGKLSEAAIERALDKNDVTEAEAERKRAQNRVKWVNTPLSEIPRKTIAVVDQILSGNSRSPIPTASDFTMSFAAKGDTNEAAKAKGVTWAAKKNLKLVEIPEGYTRGLNWFFVGSVSPPEIMIALGKPRSFKSALGVFPLFLLFFLMRRKKR